jgi:hypothetical protein
MPDKALYQKIYERMSQMETDELSAIWIKNDRGEWSDITFEVIKEILRERSVAPPTQNEPAYAPQSSQKHPHKLKEFLGIVADNNGLPSSGETSTLFYEPQKVLMLQKWIHLTMMVAIIAIVADTILAFPAIRLTVSSWFVQNPVSNSRTVPISGIIAILLNAIFQIVFTITTLKVLSYILKILMQFEFNSRAGRMKSTEASGEN